MHLFWKLEVEILKNAKALGFSLKSVLWSANLDEIFKYMSSGDH